MGWDPNEGGDKLSQEDKIIKKLDRANEQIQYEKDNKRLLQDKGTTKTNHNLIPNKTIVLAFDFISYERDQERALDNNKKFDASRQKYYKRGIVRGIYACNGMDFVNIEFDYKKGFISEGHLLADVTVTV